MPILFSSLGVAFAAACVWLAVRIVNRRERWAMATLAALLCLTVYPATYWAMLSGKVYWLVWVDPTAGQNVYATLPHYRSQDPAVERFLSLAHGWDRQLRREYWETIEHSSGRTWKNPPGAAAVRAAAP